MNYREEIFYYSVLSLLCICLLILAIVLIFLFRKKPVQSEEILPVNKNPAQAYPLADVDFATDGFNERRVIGKGRLGTVYAAMLPGGESVAVKRVHPFLVLRNAGFGFSSMIKTLSLAQHPNILSILGFSQAPGERIMVMEFVGTKSLDFYLHENSDATSLLDWSRRFRIAAGVARGLEYLHEGMAPNIVHGCFKASNVLLDDKFCARICDYGLCSLGPKDKVGLAGYVDDEYWSDREICTCKENDVYGFGVILLEILTGRRSENGLLVKWALPLIKEMNFSELLDPRLVIPSDLKPIIRLAKVASTCVSNSRRSRPTMVQVAAILNCLEFGGCIHCL